MNLSFCLSKLAVAFYMIDEIQPHRKIQNIVQCTFNVCKQNVYINIISFITFIMLYLHCFNYLHTCQIKPFANNLRLEKRKVNIPPSCPAMHRRTISIKTVREAKNEFTLEIHIQQNSEEMLIVSYNRNSFELV